MNFYDPQPVREHPEVEICPDEVPVESPTDTPDDDPYIVPRPDKEAEPEKKA